MARCLSSSNRASSSRSAAEDPPRTRTLACPAGLGRSSRYLGPSLRRHLRGPVPPVRATTPADAEHEPANTPQTDPAAPAPSSSIPPVGLLGLLPPWLRSLYVRVSVQGVTWAMVGIVASLFLGYGLYKMTQGASLPALLALFWSEVATKTALKQLLSITGTLLFFNLALEPSVRLMRKDKGPWESSIAFFVLKEVYKPLELLLVAAAVATIAEHVLPVLISVPFRYVSHVVRTLMTLAFIIAATRVSWSIKSRVLRETTWQYELSGEKMKQRRIESLDKLLTVMTVAVGTIFALQAVGFDINSLLAIGGIGGIALGLAGREVLENLFNGLLILSTQPFEPGDEVQFRPIGAPTTFVEGIVIDVGWYRTTIRSFEREVFIIPNSTFSKTVILNVTRKRTEWRHLDTLYVDVKSIDDLRRVDLSIQDMRAIVRKEPRIIQKLHKRIFLDKLNNDGTAVIFFSLYVDAATKEAFMQVKQELMIQFVEVLQNNGLGLARKTVEVGADQPLVATTNYVPYIPQGAAMPQGRFFPPGAAAAPDRGSTGPAGAFNNTNDLSLYNVDDDALPPFRPPPPPPPHIPAMAASAAPPSAPVAAPPLEPERPRTPVDAAAAAVPSASAPSVPDAAPGPLPSVRGPPPSDVRRFDPEPVQNAEFSDARLSRSPDRGQAGSPTPRDGSPAAASAPSPSPEPAEAPGPSPTSPDAELYKVMYEELRRELGAIRSLLAAPPPALAPPPPPPPPPPSPPSPTPLMAVGGTVNVAKLVASFRQPDFTLEPWTEVPVKSTLFKEPTEELEPWAAMPAAAAAPESLSTPEDASAVAPAEPAASAPAPAAPSAPVFVEFALDSSEIPPVTAAAAAVAVALATARPASPAAVRGDDAEPTEIVFHFDASASTSAPASAAPAAADGPGVVIAEGPAPLRTAGAASPASPMPVPVPAAEVKAAIASAVERAEEQLAAAAGHAAEGVTSEPGAAHANGNGNGNGIGNGASSEAQAVVRVAGDGAALQPLGVAAAPEHELAAESAEGGEMVPAGTALSPKKGSGGFKDVE